MLSLKPETGGILLDDLDLSDDYGGETASLGSASSYTGTLTGGFGGGSSSYTAGLTGGGYTSAPAGETSTGQDVASVLSSLFGAAGSIIPAIAGTPQAEARAEQARLHQALAAQGQRPPGAPAAKAPMSTTTKVGIGLLVAAGLYVATRDR